ncbi:MAG: hypothetical protein FJW63_07920 [Actinobacteria bacterium]|nr:hypothetical protein [Actinomycetota bacterium]
MKHIVILFILTFLILGGCSDKNERIFLCGKMSYWFGMSDSDDKWYEATVLEKNGDMWKIKIKNWIGWIDINESVWRKKQ